MVDKRPEAIIALVDSGNNSKDNWTIPLVYVGNVKVKVSGRNYFIGLYGIEPRLQVTKKSKWQFN